MKLPIQFALTYPNRLPTEFPRFNFLDYPSLTFEKVDNQVFQNLDLAYRAMEQEGVAACFLNAANEVAVEAFLQDRIAFIDIFKINNAVLEKAPKILSPSYEDYVLSDTEARILATEICSSKNKA
jgi:1-deoxy-D-xylulose-5-phosphate reductoisomerase